MAKIRLSVDALQVESFAAATTVSARGTVQGYQVSAHCGWTLETLDPNACRDGTYPGGSCILACDMSMEEGPEPIG